ncbi:uncharacterized protein LOC131164491 isoform X3 [Malania oleifera]|uniref:uncharacterized protein LOC131164491 isoform X3 n=1 Tax=Malania oleifera TaxID=397392 RepID=UPI0025AE41FA|nr:uncharacterized protein LOC131164491 isoform X3 [Malania oleifera]
MAGSLSSTLALCTSFLSSPQKSQTTPSSFSTFNIDDKPSLICCSKKKASFVDQILDYIEGGPKLRKWYGAPDLLPKDGSAVEEEDESSDVEEARDAVLVTDGDGEIGQMVVLSLIVKRIRVKALVKDKRAAVEAFGTYVESMTGEANDRLFLKKALRGVRAIICSNEGFFSKVGSLDGVQHVILLSQVSIPVRGEKKEKKKRKEMMCESMEVPQILIYFLLLVNLKVTHSRYRNSLSKYGVVRL